jgi:hypothetical protein
MDTLPLILGELHTSRPTDNGHCNWFSDSSIREALQVMDTLPLVFGQLPGSLGLQSGTLTTRPQRRFWGANLTYSYPWWSIPKRELRLGSNMKFIKLQDYTATTGAQRCMTVNLRELKYEATVSGMTSVRRMSRNGISSRGGRAVMLEDCAETGY